jgi:hypothetical protein
VTPAPDAVAFGRLLDALRPWLPVVVIAGGWAHRLYRLHPLAHPPPYPALMTKDADVALDPDDVPATAGIRERLIEAGFVEDFTGEDRPPVTRYRLGERSSTNVAEFLAPLTGGEYRRDGTRDVTVRVGGVNAQKLRFVDLLLLEPWTVELHAGEIQLSAPASVKVPNPASYLAQKILIHGYRKASERPKDIIYVHDTLETFAAALPDMRKTWSAHLKPTLGDKQLRRIELAIGTLEAGISDDVREAAVQARAVGRDLSASRLAEVCAYGLRELFLRSPD